MNLEKQLKILKNSLDEDDKLNTYNSIKNELDAIYDHVTEDMRIRSKYDWYEHSKKSTKFFINSLKKRSLKHNKKTYC